MNHLVESHPCGHAANPWDALLRVTAPTRLEPATAAATTARPDTKLSALLRELARLESASTLSLAACAGLTSRQVWGLLKAPRACGQVWFEDGRWSLAHKYAGRDVERAAALLRSLGWSVEPPEDD